MHFSICPVICGREEMHGRAVLEQGIEQDSKAAVRKKNVRGSILVDGYRWQTDGEYKHVLTDWARIYPVGRNLKMLLNWTCPR